MTPGLYIHVPFCARVCPYCDFAVQTGGPKKRSAYVDALVQEMGAWGARVRGAATEPGDPAGLDANQSAPSWTCKSSFDSVYIGGGTPSSLALGALETILAALFEALPIAADCTVSLETNPEDVTGANLAAWRDLGITRLSLGVQSFDDDALGLLGRTHTSVDAIGAVGAALEVGFDVVSLDLIYGVPGQSADGWRATLEQAVSLQPHHISCYELTVHEATRFFDARRRGELVEVADDAKADLFFATHRFLAAAGYPAYEVSNFARQPAYRSRHNRKYWDHSPYLGLGPSAHSFDGASARWWNERRLDGWAAVLDEGFLPIVDTESLSPEQLVLEELALKLRTTAGVDLAGIERRFGVELAGPNAEVVERLKETGLLESDTERLVPTLKGLAVADTLASSFEIASR
ncbi:MAG: radical SAM family heme chaperone HemW [Acidobacteria bacterium]|nr:radical SAM family heme chaperone HemW [Acidobacteriota bacterium]